MKTALPQFLCGIEFSCRRCQSSLNRPDEKNDFGCLNQQMNVIRHDAPGKDICFLFFRGLNNQASKCFGKKGMQLKPGISIRGGNGNGKRVAHAVGFNGQADLFSFGLFIQLQIPFNVG